MGGRTRRILLLAALLAPACGGGSPAPPTVPTASEPARTITITPAGVSPKELAVPPGTRVLFVNNDVRRHQIGSDPHPDHTECPELNAVGVLDPGRSRETGNLVVVRTCGFHDHENPANTSLHGRVVIR